MRQGGGLNAAESSDLKTFNAQESYVVEGVSIVFTQKIGEASVKFRSAARTEQERESVTAPSGARFSRERKLQSGAAVYRLEAAEPVSEATGRAALDSLNQDETVEYAFPVYVNPSTGRRIFLHDEIVVQLHPSADLYKTGLLTSFDLKFAERLAGATNAFVLKLTRPKDFNPFRVCDTIRQREDVIWAEPNKTQEFQKFAIPNDTLFGSQWHLRNTGQTTAFSDADVDADEAWDSGYGSPGVRIAILDDGVQTDHPDLNDNIVAGYDFLDSDNNPNPSHANDNHGTAVAGLAAAEVNNSTGVAGAAGKSQILPVRIAEDNEFANEATIAKAVVYAANNADIINCSWGGGAPCNMLNNAFSYASTWGRGGRGCVVLCASGNSAGGEGNQSYDQSRTYDIYAALGGVAGNYYIGFQYDKDASGSGGHDTAWLADITLPNGTDERLDSGTLPTGWQHYGNANWTTSVDAAKAHGTTRYAWRAGSIGNNQISGIATPLQAINSTTRYVTLRRWGSSASGDNFHVAVFNSAGNYLGFINIPDSGEVQNQITDVAYPANLSSVLAVGASTDFDYRSHFSQYDSTLDFVAPSSGGYGGVLTTDRTGSAGYDSGSDYVATFGGTSASAPIASGITALVLSRDGLLSSSTVIDKLIEYCDKVGPLSYTGGSPTRNDYYGHGRLNANASVDNTTLDTTAPTCDSATVVHYRAVDVAFSEPMGEGVFNPNNFSITAGQGTLSSNPAKVIRVGIRTYWGQSIYRLIWNSGGMAESGTVTIAASSSIKDVAGNSVSGTLSRSSTGTKRVLAINCGSVDTYSAPTFSTPPYLEDHGFHANEAAPLLTTSSDLFYDDEDTIYTGGVANPAPSAVYYSQRITINANPGNEITYSLPNMPSGNLKVRLHFAEINDDHYAGDQVFDIYINGTQKESYFDIVGIADAQNIAYVAEYSNITADGNGVITVMLDPQEGNYGDYRAAINGIEVVKP